LIMAQFGFASHQSRGDTFRTRHSKLAVKLGLAFKPPLLPITGANIPDNLWAAVSKHRGTKGRDKFAFIDFFFAYIDPIKGPSNAGHAIAIYFGKSEVEFFDPNYGSGYYKKSKVKELEKDFKELLEYYTKHVVPGFQTFTEGYVGVLKTEKAFAFV